MVVIIVLAGPASPVLCAHYDYTRLYQNGRKAAIEGYPRKALFFLTAAIQRRPTEGEPWVIIYGHHQEAYLPHFYLGLAFFDLGQYDEALEEWRISEEQGAVREAPQYREILTRRARIQHEILPQIITVAREELAEASSVREQIEEAVGILNAVNLNAGDLEQKSALLAEKLAASRNGIEGGKREGSFQRIEEARMSVASALLETASVLRDAQQRTSTVDVGTVDRLLSQALEGLQFGSCSRDALGRLVLLRRLTISRTDLRTDEREVRLSLGLARAYLQCGELDNATLHLVAVTQQDLAQNEISRLEGELAEARATKARQELEDFAERDAALADFTEAAAAIDVGGCERNAIERMQRTAEAVRQRPDRQQMAAWIAERAGLPYVPQIYLAKAYRECGDVENALQSLERSRERREMPLLGYERQAESTAAWVRRERGQKLYAGSYALILLASNYRTYRQGWPNVRISEAEQNKIEMKLKAIGFSVVETLRNPTKTSLERAVGQFIATFGKGAHNRNRLLIYFAGHGTRLDLRYRGASLGFLVPVDAAREPATEDEQEKFIESAVGMDQIDQWARQIEAVHALFVIDSCFSGTIFEEISRSRGGVLPIVVEESVREPARFFITASNDLQRAPDSSVFLDSLLAALTWEEDADYDGNDFLTGGELCIFLQDRVTPVTGVEPQCGKMPPPYNRGDLVFARPNSLKEDSAEPPTATIDALRDELSDWKLARESGSFESYQTYLQHHPKGRFAGLARYRLQRRQPRMS